MRFIETIKNIWAVEELRERILITLFFVMVYRLGTYIVIPGIDPQTLTALEGQTESGLLALMDMFSGGAFSNASIFAMGIMPYISASIVMQLAAIVVPSMQKLQREGESGRRKIDQWTRYLTVILLLVQAQAFLANLKSQIAQAGYAAPEGVWFTIFATIVMAAGSMFVLWLGERITDKGLGNGVSIIIMVGIISRLPGAVIAELGARTSGSAAVGGLVYFFAEILVMLLVIAGAILLVQGARRVPVQYAKRVVGNKQYGGARQYIPLKVNAANVMPIIFAQAIIMLPIMIGGYSASAQESPIFAALSNVTGFWYNFVFAILILVFTYFYTAITINPQQMAEDLKRNNGFIPGVKPGKATASFLNTIMERITLPGAIFLAVVAILPAFAQLLGVSQGFAQFFGGTSLLILVGVVLDTLQQIESHLLNRHYDGLLKTGRIKGRSGSVAAY